MTRTSTSTTTGMGLLTHQELELPVPMSPLPELSAHCMQSMGFRVTHLFTNPCRLHQPGRSSGQGEVPGECQGCICCSRKQAPVVQFFLWKVRPKAGALAAEEKGDAKAAGKGSEPATRWLAFIDPCTKGHMHFKLLAMASSHKSPISKVVAFKNPWGHLWKLHLLCLGMWRTLSALSFFCWQTNAQKCQHAFHNHILSLRHQSEEAPPWKTGRAKGGAQRCLLFTARHMGVHTHWKLFFLWTCSLSGPWSKTLLPQQHQSLLDAFCVLIMAFEVSTDIFLLHVTAFSASNGVVGCQFF